MRTKIEERIGKIKQEESDFKNKYWSHNYIKYSSMGKAYHVSEVRYSELEDDEILLFLEYLIRGQEWVSSIRAK